MKVAFVNARFECVCSFDNRVIPKNAGFYWDKDTTRWYTSSVTTAIKLEKFFDDSAREELRRTRLVHIPWTHKIVRPENEKLYDFQLEAVNFALSRNRSYLALDAGLGKTPIAAVVAQSLAAVEPAAFIYVCPPFLARNTEAEFERWAKPIEVLRYSLNRLSQMLIVPDSVLIREQTIADIKKWVKQYWDRYKVLIVDEAHRFKNQSAGRTKALFSITKHFDRVIYMSGTPMPNRPMELYPVLSNSAPETIDHMSMFEYGRRYCNGFEGPWGWDFTGASHVDELAQRITGTFMLRQRKEDVLKELPAKVEEMVIIGDDLSPKIADIDAKILAHYSPEDLAKERLQLQLGKETLHLSSYRASLGELKIKHAVEYIKYHMDETEEPLIVFAIHKAVIRALREKLDKYKPLVITGETPMVERHEITKIFQNDPQRRLIIGNIQAMGIGLTLTKARHVCFVEFSWVPGENSQASDRAHRIGQKDTVVVRYLVFKNSLDRAVLTTILNKQKTIGKL